MPLRAKKILITGGSGGIGSLLCEKLLSSGADITIVSREKISLLNVRVIQGDLSTLEGIAALIEKVSLMEIDVLVNLAGIQYFGFCEKQSSDDTSLLYAVNLMAPVLLSQALLPQMKRRGSGHIVNVGSTFGSINFAHFVAYSSSKAGLLGFTEALRREVKSDGISITYVAPRATKTPFNTNSILEFGRITRMKVDEPKWVAEKIFQAIRHKKKDVFLGFPEKLFVRLNAIFPRLMDAALVASDLKAKSLLDPK